MDVQRWCHVGGNPLCHPTWQRFVEHPSLVDVSYCGHPPFSLALKLLRASQSGKLMAPCWQEFSCRGEVSRSVGSVVEDCCGFFYFPEGCGVTFRFCFAIGQSCGKVRAPLSPLFTLELSLTSTFGEFGVWICWQSFVLGSETIS